MVHFAGYTPRLHPSDFRTKSVDGVGADWPISYGDLQPYYVDIEHELPVAGEDWPWGDPHRYPHSPHPDRRQRAGLQKGARAAGSRCMGPVAIANGRFGNRPTASTGGSASRGARSTPRPRR